MATQERLYVVEWAQRDRLGLRQQKEPRYVYAPSAWVAEQRILNDHSRNLVISVKLVKGGKP